MLKSRVFALRILPNHNNIHIIMPRRQASKIEAIHERGEQIQLLPQLNIQRAHTATDRRSQTALQAYLIPPNRFDHTVGDLAHIAVDVELLEVDRRVHRLHYLLHGTGDQGPDAVAGDERDCARSPVAGAGHVGDGSGGGEEVRGLVGGGGGGGAVEEFVEERSCSASRHGMRRWGVLEGAGFQGLKGVISEEEIPDFWKGCHGRRWD